MAAPTAARVPVSTTVRALETAESVRTYAYLESMLKPTEIRERVRDGLLESIESLLVFKFLSPAAGEMYRFFPSGETAIQVDSTKHVCVGGGGVPRWRG